MDNIIWWIYYSVLSGDKDRIKPLRICHSIDPNLKSEPAVMHKKWFKKSGDGSGMVGKFDDVYMGCSVKQHFSELRGKSK